MIVVYIICSILVIISSVIFITNYLIERNNNNRPLKQEKKKPRFSILIPAKDESKVIRGLIDSIEKQTRKIPMNDIYVIVESTSDPTVNICKEYQCQYIVRKHLELKRKGYALDEAIKEIKTEYDAYFIIDADNILDEDFIKYMEEVYLKGYDIGVGYRDNKNWSDNAVSACSGLIFEIANHMNERKNKTNENISITGTGFYIKGSIIKKFNGYPFHELTEDYELTLYATVHKLTTYYEPKAIFYDEQPAKFSQTIKQRIRWVKGYLNVRRIYLHELKASLEDNKVNYGSVYKEIMWLTPIVTLVIALLLYYLSLVINIIYLLITNNFHPVHLLVGLVITLIIYIILAMFTVHQLRTNRTKIKLSNFLKIKVILYNPLYLLSFIYCAIVAITNDNITWEKIDHTKENIRG